MESSIKRDFSEIVQMMKRYIHQQLELGTEEIIFQKRIEQAEKITIGELRRRVESCSKCKALYETRTNVVFGDGNKNADLVFVGEAPGYNEDQQGLPFVGRAGQLLDRILKSVDLSREDVYITNILKCRPPDNRNPLEEEIANCEPYLITQLNLIKPKLICALGTYAAQTLLRTKRPISHLRGAFSLYNNIPLLPTYHPAFLLRNTSFKRQVWEDIQLLKAKYDQVKQRIRN